MDLMLIKSTSKKINAGDVFIDIDAITSMVGAKKTKNGKSIYLVNIFMGKDSLSALFETESEAKNLFKEILERSGKSEETARFMSDSFDFESLTKDDDDDDCC